jgi:hypothetical protein
VGDPPLVEVNTHSLAYTLIVEEADVPILGAKPLLVDETNPPVAAVIKPSFYSILFMYISSPPTGSTFNSENTADGICLIY